MSKVGLFCTSDETITVSNRTSHTVLRSLVWFGIIALNQRAPSDKTRDDSVSVRKWGRYRMTFLGTT